MTDEIDNFLAEAQFDGNVGNLIPGGFGGPCEFSDELEAAIRQVALMASKGLTVNEQTKIADCIREAIEAIESSREESTSEH